MVFVHGPMTRYFRHLEDVGAGLGRAGQEARPKRMAGEQGGIKICGNRASLDHTDISIITERPVANLATLVDCLKIGPASISAAASHARSVSTGRRWVPRGMAISWPCAAGSVLDRRMVTHRPSPTEVRPRPRAQAVRNAGRRRRSRLQSARGLDAALRQAEREGYELVVLDTAPHADQAALQVARLADLVLVPMRPSILDLDAMGASLDLCVLARRPAAVVLNAAPVR